MSLPADFKCLQTEITLSFRSAFPPKWNIIKISGRTMESEEESPSHAAQCPAGSAMGRRNVEANSERVELTLGVKASKPRVSFELSSRFSDDDEVCAADHHSHREHEDNSDYNHGPGIVYAKVEASQKDIQRGKDKETAAAQTQMPSTKPKARTLVACRQLSDGSKAASLRDQSHLPLLTLRGTVSTDPGQTSLHASIIGEASASPVQPDEAQRFYRRLHNVSREENRRQYYKELCLQVNERKQEIEREKRRNVAEEQKHMETMQNSVWGMPGSGAPNYHLGTAKRTRSLYTSGILSQDQIRDTAFRETPFHRR